MIHPRHSIIAVSAILCTILISSSSADQLNARNPFIPGNGMSFNVSRQGGICGVGPMAAMYPSCAFGLVCRMDRVRPDNRGVCQEMSRDTSGMMSHATEGELCGGSTVPMRQCAAGLVCRMTFHSVADNVGRCTRASVPPRIVSSPFPARGGDKPKEQPSNDVCPPNQKLSPTTGRCTSNLASVPAQEHEECGGPFSDARQCATGLICQFQIPTPPDATGRCKVPPPQVFSKEGEECGESFFLANQCAAGLVCKYEESEVLNVFGKCVRST
ncbi:hypothetical protein BDF22DRAFT_674038 [Syncephalis plumigaleata]|nr:hypothetical protein BDF22DRAFT_674038 [Syncephalis plumigaleata]